MPELRRGENCAAEARKMAELVPGWRTGMSLRGALFAPKQSPSYKEIASPLRGLAMTLRKARQIQNGSASWARP